MENNNLGLVFVSVALLFGLIFAGLGIRNGLSRAAAISAGMSPQQYSDWIDLVQ